MSFAEEINGIYRLKVPFESVYTSVFLIRSGQGNALVDCATYASDVDKYILPALKEKGLSITDICCLVLTHKHGDHAGGKNRILELVPSIKIVQEIPSIINDNLPVLAEAAVSIVQSLADGISKNQKMLMNIL